MENLKDIEIKTNPFNIWEVYQEVVSIFKKKPNISFRGAAHELDLKKSAVQRHKEAFKRRNQFPESGFWDGKEGYHFLKLLVYATLFLFGIQRGVGAETLSLFFHLIRIDTHIGVSPTSLRKIMSRMEGQILQFNEICKQKSDTHDREIKITAGLDETFFEQMILVLMDLNSGFIFLEEFSAQRTFITWKDRIDACFTQWKVEVGLVVSDRAKALIKVAVDGFKCLHIPDIFHAMNEIVKAMGLAFKQKSIKAQKQKKEANDSLLKIEQSIKIPSESTEKILSKKQSIVLDSEKQTETVEKGKKQYRNCLHDISKAVHPFSADESLKQTSREVSKELIRIYQELIELKDSFQIKDSSDGLSKFEKQIKDIGPVVDHWWTMVDQSLLLEHLDIEKYRWLCFLLLPFVYWDYQVQRTDTTEIREAYRTYANKAREALSKDPYTEKISRDEWHGWVKWADDMAKSFQRASSAVEGRNGYLSQVYHTRRGISSQRLMVLTVIFNFWLKRPDGTTAGQRLFGIDFGDLFKYLVETADPLPFSRISTKARGSPNHRRLLNVLNLDNNSR